MFSLHNINEKKSNNVDWNYHEGAIQEAHGILNCFEKLEENIGYHSGTAFHERCSEYQKKEMFHFYGKQDLALMEHRDIL